jgi:hypothetical protein
MGTVFDELSRSLSDVNRPNNVANAFSHWFCFHVVWVIDYCLTSLRFEGGVLGFLAGQHLLRWPRESK